MDTEGFLSKCIDVFCVCMYVRMSHVSMSAFTYALSSIHIRWLQDGGTGRILAELCEPVVRTLTSTVPSICTSSEDRCMATPVAAALADQCS